MGGFGRTGAVLVGVVLRDECRKPGDFFGGAWIHPAPWTFFPRRRCAVSSTASNRHSAGGSTRCVTTRSSTVRPIWSTCQRAVEKNRCARGFPTKFLILLSGVGVGPSTDLGRQSSCCSPELGDALASRPDNALSMAAELEELLARQVDIGVADMDVSTEDEVISTRVVVERATASDCCTGKDRELLLVYGAAESAAVADALRRASELATSNST